MSDEGYNSLYQSFPAQGPRQLQGDRRLDSTVVLEGTFDEFARDVRAAVAVWPTAPWLPIVSAVVGGSGFSGVGGSQVDQAAPMSPLAPVLVAAAAVLLLALFVFSMGWAGVERQTYARIWSHEDFTFSEAFGMAWGYVGRFLVLGLLLLIPMIILTWIVQVFVGPLAAAAIATFVLYVVLTFVAPALAYDDDRATDALRVGWRMLCRQGRRAIWYAGLVPAVLGVLFALSGTNGAAGWVLWPASALVALVFKGAIAAAYLRLSTPDAASVPPSSAT